jgi:hypothetical protein
MLKFVIFTGSMCLQLECIKTGTPMLFVPYLTEQYFWAKNYKATHNREYLDPLAPLKEHGTKIQDIDICERLG